MRQIVSFVSFVQVVSPQWIDRKVQQRLASNPHGTWPKLPKTVNNQWFTVKQQWLSPQGLYAIFSKIPDY